MEKLTITVQIKVNDGVVLASDSATTITVPNGGIVNVYDNANKLFNLVKVLPIGVGTWGNGSFGQASISTLIKDYRAQISGSFQRQSYSIEEETRKLAKFLYEEHWLPAHHNLPDKPYTGFVVAGYPAHSSDPEIWHIDIGQNPQSPEPQISRVDTPGQSTVVWDGQQDAITRLIKGYVPQLQSIMQICGVTVGVQQQIFDKLGTLEQSLITAPMPIQDAIDLGAYLVDLTARYVRFIPGAPTVGGPMEIAAITKHEGFKWIKRKHFYSQEFNQPVEE